MTQTTTNHAHQISHPEKVKIKFMYCLHSISLTFKAGPCHNLCSCYIFHNKQKKNRTTTTTTNDSIQKSVRMTHWIEDFGLRISSVVHILQSGTDALLWFGWFVTLPSNVIKLQLVVKAAIDDWFMAINMRLNGVKLQQQQQRKSAHTNNKTSVVLKPVDIQ